MFGEEILAEKLMNDISPSFGTGPPSLEVAETTNQVSHQVFSNLEFPILEEVIPQSTRFEVIPNFEDVATNLSIQQPGFMVDSFEFQIQEIDSEIKRYDKDEAALAGKKIMASDDYYQD